MAKYLRSPVPTRADALPSYLKPELQRIQAAITAVSAEAQGSDPALAPIGTEVALYSDEFNAATLNTTDQWSWLNQGTSTEALWQGRLIFSGQASGGAGHRVAALVQTVPSGSWTIRTRVANYSTLANQMGGLFAYRSTSGDFVTHETLVRVAPPVSGPFSSQWAGTYWTDFTTPSVNFFGAVNVEGDGREAFFQLRYDGTNFLADYSPDNVQFVNLGTVTAATAIGGAPTSFGLFVNGIGVTPGAVLGFDWFRCYANSTINQGP